MAMSAMQMKGKALRGALEQLLGALSSANVDRARKKKASKKAPSKAPPVEAEDDGDEEC